jgi:hypothetical protein
MFALHVFVLLCLYIYIYLYLYLNVYQFMTLPIFIYIHSYTYIPHMYIECFDTVSVMDAAEVRRSDIPYKHGGLLAVSQSGNQLSYSCLHSYYFS